MSANRMRFRHVSQERDTGLRDIKHRGHIQILRTIGRNAKFKTTISELGAMTVTINPTHLKWWGLTDRED